MSSCLEGLYPCFHPRSLKSQRLKLREEDFNQHGIDPARVYDPVPNVIESESVLFDDSDVGCRMVEAVFLPGDRQAMCFNEETAAELAQIFANSSAVVSFQYIEFLFLPVFCF